MFYIVLEKIILGISLAAPFGPLSLYSLNCGIHKGFKGAFLARVGGATGSLFLLSSACFFLNVINDNQRYITVISTLSSIYLFYLGINSFSKKDIVLKVPESKRIYINGILLSVVNPLGIPFWLSIVGSSALVMGFYINLWIIVGYLIWGVIFAAFATSFKFLSDKVKNMVNNISAILLLILAIKYMYLSFSKILY